MKPGVRLSWCGLLGLIGAVLLAGGGSPVAAAVPIKVSGLGLWRDHDLRLALERLMNARSASSVDSNAIEDGAVILTSALSDEGFQEPRLEIVVTTETGEQRRFEFDPTFANPVPRPIVAKTVAFDVHPGVRWHVSRVEIEGLSLFSHKQAEGYFRSDATLLRVAQTNAYSKGRVNRSESALLDDLRRRGYGDASVQAELAGVDRKTGAVTLHVRVHEGPKWVVQQVTLRDGHPDGVSLPDFGKWNHDNWTPTLEQEIRESVRQAFYRRGFPDVDVRVAVTPGPPEGATRPVRFSVTAAPGKQVTMGNVRFEGNRTTRESVLKRRVSLKPGDPLNPIELEHSRYRISRLGVFDSVDLRYEPQGGTTRDPVFTLKESPHFETNLLAGYGSYEQLRGGVELRQVDILGLAHQSRLLVVQSMKSTRGDYTYTVPELFGETIDGTAKVFGLQRQEIAFQRQEYGATLSLRRPINPLHGEATVGYTFEALRNRKNALSTVMTDEKQLNVASLTFGLTTDRRDNALRPRRGYHATAQVEIASPWVGGVAQYQRVELGGAYHTPWGRSRWIHVGLSHGVLTTAGAASDRNLPVNKRFFPGGDNSIRGYQSGEAAPRLPDGRFLGAKSYLLVNLELEQALTRTWSIVAFGDALGTAATLRDYPFRERLYSVGLGLRYQTIVGPVRLEYGRNVNPRPADPPGTWQISIGYPF